MDLNLHDQIQCPSVRRHILQVASVIIIHFFLSSQVYEFDFSDHSGVDHFLVKVTSHDQQQGSTICSITSVQDGLVCMLHVFSCCLDLYCILYSALMIRYWIIQSTEEPFKPCYSYQLSISRWALEQALSIVRSLASTCSVLMSVARCMWC